MVIGKKGRLRMADIANDKMYWEQALRAELSSLPSIEKRVEELATNLENIAKSVRETPDVAYTGHLAGLTVHFDACRDLVTTRQEINKNAKLLRRSGEAGKVDRLFAEHEYTPQPE